MTNRYDVNRQVVVTIPGWVYTHIWNFPGMSEEHRNLWKGTHDHTISMYMTLQQRNAYLGFIQNRIRQDVEHLWDYPGSAVSSVTAFQKFYDGTKYAYVEEENSL